MYFTLGQIVVILFAINVNREMTPFQNLACKKDLSPIHTARKEAAFVDLDIPQFGQTLGDHWRKHSGKIIDVLKSVTSVRGY